MNSAEIARMVFFTYPIGQHTARQQHMHLVHLTLGVIQAGQSEHVSDTLQQQPIDAESPYQAGDDVQVGSTRGFITSVPYEHELLR